MQDPKNPIDQRARLGLTRSARLALARRVGEERRDPTPLRIGKFIAMHCFDLRQQTTKSGKTSNQIIRKGSWANSERISVHALNLQTEPSIKELVKTATTGTIAQTASVLCPSLVQVCTLASQGQLVSYQGGVALGQMISQIVVNASINLATGGTAGLLGAVFGVLKTELKLAAQSAVALTQAALKLAAPVLSAAARVTGQVAIVTRATASLVRNAIAGVGAGLASAVSVPLNALQRRSLVGAVGDRLANRLATGKISGNLANRIATYLRETMGTKIIYNSKQAKRLGRNWYDPTANEIHFRTPKAETGRGVFCEEVQHALDEFANPKWNQKRYMGGNERMHAGTFYRLANNPLFELTESEIEAFVAQAEAWAKWCRLLTWAEKGLFGPPPPSQ